MNLISEDYLMHHGVKGMKWGVRHDPDRTSKAFRKLQNFDEGYASGEYKGKKAEKTRNKLIKKANTLYNKDKKEKAQNDYKDMKKSLKKAHKDQYKEYSKAWSEAAKKTNAAKKVNKDLYKSGKIQKEEYRTNKKYLTRQRDTYQQKIETQMAIGQYKIRKAEHLNKTVYMKSIHGENSRQYKAGLKKVKRSTENWANYTITKYPDNSYRVVRTDVYVY